MVDVRVVTVQRFYINDAVFACKCCSVVMVVPIIK